MTCFFCFLTDGRKRQLHPEPWNIHSGAKNSLHCTFSRLINSSLMSKCHSHCVVFFVIFTLSVMVISFFLFLLTFDYAIPSVYLLISILFMLARCPELNSPVRAVCVYYIFCARDVTDLQSVNFRGIWKFYFLGLSTCLLGSRSSSKSPGAVWPRFLRALVLRAMQVF